MEAYFAEFMKQVGALSLRAVYGFGAFAFLWAAGVFVEKLLAQMAEKAAPGRREVGLLAARSAGIGIKILGVVSGLGTAGVNVSALVAGLGLTGFALGFALKDAISNLLAGCMILVYRPFRRGDRIAVTGLEGRVSNVDLRYTSLDAEGKRFLIPNALLLNNAITVSRPAKEDPPPRL
ncbi:MAG: mechanosensitive ion channel family protein [Elusimicrobiota bacterium]